MNKDSESTTAVISSVLEEDEMRDEYDFSQMKGGVRGKYAARYREGTNLILLAPDVATVFPDEKSVNDALRKLIAQGFLENAH